MTASRLRPLLLCGLLAFLCGAIAQSSSGLTREDRMLANANADRDDWRLHGRTYDNQRFSPLTGINRDTLGKLELLHVLHTGVATNFEATPLVVDGVMYFVTSADHVQAWDAVSGQQLWSWAPE